MAFDTSRRHHDSITPMERIVHHSETASMMAFLPSSTRRLLDIGCGSGLFGARVKSEREGCRVTGITVSEDEAAVAAKRLDTVVVRDLRTEDLSDLGTFDCVVCSHTLGYFHDLPRILGAIRGALPADGVFVATVPNVLHWRQRLEFLRGRFRYGDSGILHYHYARFFDYESSGKFLQDAGFEILARDSEGYVPMPLLRRLLGNSRARNLDRAMVRRFPGFLATEFILAARPVPAPTSGGVKP